MLFFHIVLCFVCSIWIDSTDIFMRAFQINISQKKFM